MILSRALSAACGRKTKGLSRRCRDDQKGPQALIMSGSTPSAPPTANPRTTRRNAEVVDQPGLRPEPTWRGDGAPVLSSVAQHPDQEAVAMKEFLASHAGQIAGVLRGPDRVVLRGHLQMLATASGLFSFLDRIGKAASEWKDYFVGVTQRVTDASLTAAKTEARPVIYVASSAVRKEELARRELAKTPVTEGLACVLKAVEPCKTYEVKTNRCTGRTWLESRYGKCLHLYHYFVDPEFGFMSARLETWFPFTIQIWINGREWLHRRLLEAGASNFEKHENCFTRLDDFEAAQRLFDRFQSISWQQSLARIAQRLNPLHDEIFSGERQDYYWSIFQSEWAVDVLFKEPDYLQSLFPRIASHAINQMSCADVLRFLGRRPDGRFQGESRGIFLSRSEGLRIKHWVDKNSLKAYVRGNGRVLRGELTMNHPEGFKVYRPKASDPDTYAWQPLRKGIADSYRRAQVSDQAVNRYLDSFAAIDRPDPLGVLIHSLCSHVCKRGRRYRALSPLRDDDARLLEAVNRGEFAVNGFRNRDLAPLVSPPTTGGPADLRRRAAKVTRLLALLRAHSIIRKVPGSHRYIVTTAARTKIAAILAARQASVAKLVASVA
jgi:hypothetical protein